MDTFDLEMQRDRFLKVFDEQIGDREGKEALREWLLEESDFFTSPASTKYHGNYIGGLCEHRHKASWMDYDPNGKDTGSFRNDLCLFRKRQPRPERLQRI